MTTTSEGRDRPRVVVTGLGVKTPAGNDVQTFWSTVNEARSCAAPITRFDASELPVRFGCEVHDFDATDYIGPKEARRLDRTTQLGFAAASDALADAGDISVDPARCAVISGTGIGGLVTIEDGIHTVAKRGPSRISPFFIPMMMANASAGLIAMRFGWTGPNLCISTACASGANAIGEAGRLIREIQRPRNAALLVVAAIALIGASATATGRRGRSPPRKPPAISPAGRSLSFYGPAGGNVLAVLVPIMLASVALPVLLYVQGDTRERTETVPFVERGTFSYEAVAGSGVYDGDHLGAPEPLFRRLTDDLPLLYEYEVTPSAPGEELSNVTGSYRLFAEIRQENGWKRTIELQPTMLFAGDRFSTSAVIDLRTVDRLIDGVEEQTGVIADVYRLRVVANVQVEGDLAGRPFTRQLEQALEFRLTDLQLQLMTRSSTIEWTDTGTVTRTVEVGRALSIPLVSLDIPYSTFPILAAVGIGVAALGLLLMALATFLIWRAGEPARIRARYGHRMVAIEVEEGASGEQPLVVDRFDDLVHIADRAGLVILHWEDAMFDDYLVFDQRTSYRYTIWKLPDGWPPELRNVVGPMPGGAQSPFERAA